MSDEREQRVLDRIASANLLLPSQVIFSNYGGSIAVAFEINNATETIEGCGDCDTAATDDVIRQLRTRLIQGYTGRTET